MKDIVFQSIKDAVVSNQAAFIATKTMNDNLTEVMRKLLTPGQIIDIAYDQSRDWDYWLLDVRTLRGNDHGAKKFRIESEVTVEARPDSFEFAKWSCEATPINKSGKELNGRSHGANGNRPTVKLVGNIMPSAPFNIEGESYRQWCTDMLSSIIDLALNRSTKVD